MDQDPLKSRQAAAGGAAAEKPASSRPAKSAAERKREQRERERGGSTTVGGKASDFARSVGDRFRSDPIGRAGEKISPKEAEEELYHAHVAVAKVIGSSVDMAGLKEEFEVAGESFATIANHMWPPLRLLIRFIAPLVLAGALIAIWAAILAETPWVRRLGEWWSNRNTGEPAAAEELRAEVPWSSPHVVQSPNPPAPVVPDQAEPMMPHPPVPDVRSMRQR